MHIRSCIFISNIVIFSPGYFLLRTTWFHGRGTNAAVLELARRLLEKFIKNMMHTCI